MPFIEKTDVVHSTPWCELVRKTIGGGHDAGQEYYALRLPDYVAIFAQRDDRKIILVRQYRPAVEQTTLELPAGTVAKGEPPEATARRELEEETGHTAGKMRLIGKLKPDTGRLWNHMFCYLATDVHPMKDAPPPEPGVETVICNPAEFDRLIETGQFDHALHLAVVFLARRALTAP